MALAFHTDHPSLIGELHSRPHPVLEAPCSLAHLAVLPDPGSSSLRPQIEALCRQYGQPEPSDDRHHSVMLGQLRLRWERHTEFESITVIRADTATDSTRPLDDLPEAWLESLNGTIVSATRITVRKVGSGPRETDVTAGAGPTTIVGGSVLDGAGEVRTDLTADNRGFVDFYLELDERTTAERTGRLIQLLIEVETYRMMALLGLPAARSLGPKLNRLEERLVEVVRRLGQTDDLTREQPLLDDLFGIAQSSEELLSANAFRFSATTAYGRIVRDRLEELRERPVPGRQPLGKFLYRRFEPAVRTCHATRERQESLGQRISRTADLARTRVDVTLQGQNRSLLSSMARRASMQLRLQQTVEGLSVMAIGYYSIGILAYLLGGWMPTDTLKLAISASTPLFLVAIWWLLRRWRHNIGKQRFNAE